MMSSPSSPRIGVIGVGNMGLGIALRLHDQGLPVTVCDIDPARIALARLGGCGSVDTPAALARACDLAIVVVVDARQTRDVLFGAHGAAAALKPGSGVLLCPTIAPADVQALAEDLTRHHLDVLDAPMSGGPQRAREGRMSLMVAGSDAAFERWQPVLRQMADPLFRISSKPGDGARTKLVNNLLAAINLMGASEVLALATRLGLDPSRTLDVIEGSSGQSWIGSHRLRRALAGDDQVHAHVALLAKDSALAMNEARQAPMAPGDDPGLAVGAAAHAGFERALAQGLGRADDSALYRWLIQQQQQHQP